MNTWEIDSITSVPKFLAAIAEFLPAAQAVSFEIQNACPEALEIYAKHRSKEKIQPLRDTISPRTQLHYCTISKALAGDLDDLLRSHDIARVLWHIKGFEGTKMLFAIHDADLGDSVCFSGKIESSVVRSIGAALGRKPVKRQSGYEWDKDYRRKAKR